MHKWDFGDRDRRFYLCLSGGSKPAAIPRGPQAGQTDADVGPLVDLPRRRRTCADRSLVFIKEVKQRKADERREQLRK